MFNRSEQQKAVYQVNGRIASTANSARHTTSRTLESSTADGSAAFAYKIATVCFETL